MRYWSSPPHPDLSTTQHYLDRIHASFAAKTLFQWGIVRNAEADLIGTCTLAHLDAQNRRAEVGYILGRPHWGHGYAQEALQALVAFAFQDLDLLRLEADVDPRNTASTRSLSRLGFTLEGHLRERWIVGGEISDSVLYGLLRREWSGGALPAAPRPT